MDTAVDLLSQFTGTGGGTKHALVNFGVAAIFWTLLLTMARVAPSRHTDPTAKPLMLGFAFALTRELLMLTVKIFEAYETFSPADLHLVFPPLEHALSNVGLALIAGSYAARLTGNHTLWLKFSAISVSVLGAVYLSTAVWWAQFSYSNPDIRFGQTWTDWAFRITTSIILAVAVIAILRAPKTKIGSIVAVSLSLFFGNEFLKIIDMAYGEQYESTFAVIRHTLFLAALPLLAGAYIRDEAAKLSGFLHQLEDKVQARTIELDTAVERLQSANEELQTLSATDALTGVGNRKAFDDNLSTLWQHSSRGETQLSLLAIDLDKFKDINDRYGHAVGDQALKLVAESLQKVATRQNDSVARVGGDEFAVLLPETDEVAARELAERVQEEIANKLVGEVLVTLSIGVATIQPSEVDLPEELVNHADRALYAAKDAGRDTIGVFDAAMTAEASPIAAV